jgi:hypothetical protein
VIVVARVVGSDRVEATELNVCITFISTVAGAAGAACPRIVVPVRYATKTKALAVLPLTVLTFTNLERVPIFISARDVSTASLVLWRQS